MKKAFRLTPYAFSLKHLLPLTTAVAALLGAPSLSASTATWVNPNTSGNWSDPTQWSTNPTLPGSLDIVNFDATSSASTVVSTIDAAAWSVNGISVSTSGQDVRLIGSKAPTGPTILTIGSGGVTLTDTNHNGGGTFNLGGIFWQNPAADYLTLNLVENQTWSTNGAGDNNAAIYINADITGSAQVTINNTSTDWQNGVFSFQGGVSTAFTGSFILEAGKIRLSGPAAAGGSVDKSQLDRLGTNALVFRNTTVSGNTYNALELNSISGTNQQLSFITPIKFENTGTKERQFSVLGRANVNSSITIAGWSGSLDNGTDSVSGVRITSNVQYTNNSYRPNELLLRFTEDNQNLTSTKQGGNLGTSAIWLSMGSVSLEHVNAWGAGNNLSVAMGQQNLDPTGIYYAGLFTNNGINVASNIYVLNGAVHNSNITELGIRGTGSAAYTGDITLQRGWHHDDSNGQETTNLHLTAGAGATVTFSGNISDTSNDGWDPYRATMIAQGGGAVILSGSNSVRAGETSVINGTTLLANGGSISGSTTGDGSLLVGYNAASTTGAVTTTTKTIAVASTAGFVVGQSISGTGIPAGSIVTHVDAGTIEVSELPTEANADVVLTGAAETGVLGGNGRIRPGTSTWIVDGPVHDNSIRIASGGSIAPGATVGGIGALTFDGGSTAAALLTLDAGATFTFDLGTGNQSDQIVFWNYTDGDLVLNTNTINLANVEAGTYTLFSFYGDGGTAAVDNNVISGLLAGLTFSQYDIEHYDAKLATSGNTITMTVVPEPATWAMLVGGMGLLAFGQRMRRRAA